MADTIHTSFWNYNKFSDYKPEMMNDWVECGITTPMAPEFKWESDSHEKLFAMLDRADELGAKVILQIDKLYLHNYEKGAEEYEADVKEIWAEVGSHPALAGFYVAEEPNAKNEECYLEGVKIIKKIAPDVLVYINMGSIERTERMLLEGRNVEEWVKNYTEHTGSDIMGFGSYSQLLRDYSGTFEHFYNIRTFVNAGKKAGADIWATMLSSAHDFYRVATEDDFRWQLNTCIACGCKAVLWFRFYDKLVAFDYRSSPIDEFGVKTQRYYDLARVQKRFNIHYGKVFPKLSHIESYGLGVSYGGYPYFTPAASDLVASADCRSGMISFFKDEAGNPYVVVVNTHMTEAYHVSLSFTEKVKKADLVYHNEELLMKKFERGDKKGDISIGQMCLAPGQMEVFKLYTE